MAGHAIVSQAIRVTNGTQDYTKSGLGVPKGYLIFGSEVTLLNTDSNHAVLCVGASDLSANNGAMININSEDAQATSDTSRIQQSDEVFRLAAAGTSAADEQANHDATITDGIRLDFVTTADAHIASVLLFSEGISDIDVQYTTLNATTDTTITTGFQPDIVFVYSVGLPNEFSSGNPELHFGIYDRINNTYVNICANAGHSATTQSGSEAFQTNKVTGAFSTAGSIFEDWTLGNFTGTGFDMIEGIGSDARDMIFFSIKLDAGYEAEVGTFAAPTSTGVASVISGKTFTPQLALLLGNNLLSAGTSADGMTYFIGACVGAEEFAIGGFHEETAGVANTNTQSFHRSDSCVYHLTETGVLNSKAAFDSFPTGGLDLNFSIADRAILVGYFIIGLTGGIPIITDVNTTETWNDGDTGLVITGTGFV